MSLTLTNLRFQCSFPCFDGLLPDSKDNSIVIDTLFISATWHAFAKARMHTDSTVQVLRAVTSLLGHQLRLFSSKVCPNFRTKETPSEMAARVRRLIRMTRKKAAAASTTGGIYKSVKAFNLFMYKHHSLGNYQWTIPRFRTIDSYSTQIVSDNYKFSIVINIHMFARASKSIIKSNFSMHGPTREAM